MSAETPLREALEAEWYNGNMTEGAYDRILAALAAHRVEPAPTLDVERLTRAMVTVNDNTDRARGNGNGRGDNGVISTYWWHPDRFAYRVAREYAADTPPSDAPEEATR